MSLTPLPQAGWGGHAASDGLYETPCPPKPSRLREELKKRVSRAGNTDDAPENRLTVLSSWPLCTPLRILRVS